MNIKYQKHIVVEEKILKSCKMKNRFQNLIPMLTEDKIKKQTHHFEQVFLKHLSKWELFI